MPNAVAPTRIISVCGGVRDYACLSGRISNFLDALRYIIFRTPDHSVYRICPHFACIIWDQQRLQEVWIETLAI